MFSDSSTTIIYNIVNTMGWIAGIACVAMIVMAVIKIITGDESDAKIYLRRIKNGIVAFILIFSITSITRLVVNSYIGTDEATIGDFSQHAYQIGKDALTVKDGKDVQLRQIIGYNNMKLVRTDVDQTIKEGTFWHKIKMKVDVYRSYDDCQGAMKGWGAEKLYYVFKSSDDVGDLEERAKYYIFPVDSVDDIDGTKESFENLIGNYDYNKNGLLFTVLTNANGEISDETTNPYKDTDDK